LNLNNNEGAIEGSSVCQWFYSK